MPSKLSRSAVTKLDCASVFERILLMQFSKPFLVSISDDYRNILAAVDKHVPFNKSERNVRPYLGIIVPVDTRLYALPFVSPKPKFKNWKERPGYFPLKDNRLGALQIINMLPIAFHPSVILPIHISHYTEIDKGYGNIIKSQYEFLSAGNNLERACKNAETLLERHRSNTLSPTLEKVALDFTALEERLTQYLIANNLPQELAFADSQNIDLAKPTLTVPNAANIDDTVP